MFMTPCVGTVNLYKTSGHWDHYKENMFPPMEMEGESFVLRPMNCPHHMMIYANRRHSYKDLPMRIGEIAHDFRFEASGTLKGIERGRHFCQNRRSPVRNSRTDQGRVQPRGRYDLQHL